jgi:hypothetical protein
LTISTSELVERIETITAAFSDSGWTYEVHKDMDYSPAMLSRLTGQSIIRPTMAEAKQLCPPIVNVHGSHYQATLLGPVAVSNIMRQYKMFSPMEVFWHGDWVSHWDGFMRDAERGGPFIKDVPVTFISQRTEDRIVGNMMYLFLDRCVLNQTVSDNLNVRYYELPVERDPVKDVH